MWAVRTVSQRCSCEKSRHAMCRRLWILRRRGLPVVTCVSSLSCAQVNVCVPISYLQSCGVRVHVCDCVSTVSVLSVCIAAAVHEACACRVRVPVRDRCRQDTSEEVACPTSARVAAGAHVRELCVWVLFSVSRSGDAQPLRGLFFRSTHIALLCVWCVGPDLVSV
jgi:hypothetical protein